MKKYLLGTALVAAMFAAAPAANAATNLITNGSFEDGVYIADGGFVTLSNGDNTSIAGWTVLPYSIDYVGTYWQASDGLRSLDLSGAANGGVSQTIATISGKVYTVSFDLAGNPDGADETKFMVTTLGNGVGGGAAKIFTFDVGAGNTREDMGWKTFSYTFTATSNSTTLNFASANESPYGPALDNVSVSAVPEPATWAMMIVGFGAAGAMVRNRRKLVPTVA
jgi:choice-of-anchor C domain-containing protein